MEVYITNQISFEYLIPPLCGGMPRQTLRVKSTARDVDVEHPTSIPQHARDKEKLDIRFVV